MFSFFDGNMRGLCAICSATLVRVLRKRGYHAKIFWGRFGDQGHHCWVEYDGWVYDITASQFREIKKPLYKIKQGGRRYKELYLSGVEIKTIRDFNP